MSDSEIDTSYYVLTVDLWSAEGTQEVNLVRHSATAPSISTAVSSSYPPPPQAPTAYPAYAPPQSSYQAAYNQSRPPPPQGQPVSSHLNSYPPQAVPGGYYVSPATGQISSAGYYTQAPPPAQPMPQPPAPPAPQARAPTGMFTRNLIGSLSASAFRLTDPDNKIGVWFILQDLSVRTEGQFRYVDQSGANGVADEDTG